MRLLTLLVLAVAVLPVVRRFGKVSGFDSSGAGQVLGGTILATALGRAACMLGVVVFGLIFLACGTAASWAGTVAAVLALLWYLDFPGDTLISALGRLVLAWKRRQPQASESCPQA